MIRGESTQAASDHWFDVVHLSALPIVAGGGKYVYLGTWLVWLAFGPPGSGPAKISSMENRHIDPLRRIGQADETWAADGHEPSVFHLNHSGEGPKINHPRWDRSWSTPSEQTIDDLEELGYLRVAPHHNKARSFDLTMAGRVESALQRRRSGAEVGGQPPIAVEPTIDLTEPEDVVVAPPSPISTNDLQDAEIFVVHGHSRKSDVALFLASVTKTQPVILDERAGRGRTIIEKFEQESGGSGFAVVLLTADDPGTPGRSGSAALRHRGWSAGVSPGAVRSSASIKRCWAGRRAGTCERAFPRLA